MSQVGVFLSLVTPAVNTWIDGELYIPIHWFEERYAEKRKAIGIPPERTFQKKPELGWQMIQKAQARKIPFQAVVMDDLYGRNGVLRQQLDEAHIEYYGDVPVDTQVYLAQPEVVYPLTKWEKPSKNPKIVGAKAYQVQELGRDPTLLWQTIRLRPNKRGDLEAKFARCRVWVVYGTQVRQEWLLIRQDAVQVTYVLSNAAEDTSLETMAWRKTHRYLIERSNQDEKGELGWDEFQTRKFCVLGTPIGDDHFSRMVYSRNSPGLDETLAQDPALLAKYEVEVLPQLSIGNVQELLRAAMPLPQLSPQEAAQLVTSHLVNRTRSRKSHLKKARDKSR